jgi:hypothetical protein
VFVSFNCRHLSPERDVSSYRNSYKKGREGKKDIARRDAESLTMETRRVDASHKIQEGERRGENNRNEYSESDSNQNVGRSQLVIQWHAFSVCPNEAVSCSNVG